MGSHNEEPLSLECVKRSDMYPKMSPVCDDPSLQQIPFPLLCGENGLFLGRSAEGVVTLTNFRLHICQRKSFLNIPLRLIESVESRDMFYLVILCKDATTVRCKFSNNEGCQLWLKRISECTGPPKDLTKIFAFAFYSHGSELEGGQLSAQASVSAYDQAAQLCVPLEEKYAYSFGKDVERMLFDTSKKKVWRILQTNQDYSLCGSYPKYHIVPGAITDDQIKSVAGFRSGSRFPSVVWRDSRNGAVIVRCSQPELGWLGWRNTEDELLAKIIPEACAQDAGANSYHRYEEEIIEDTSEEGHQGSKVKVLTAKKMLVMDCRSYSAAIANRAKGGGCESPDYYTNCEIKFMNMANIHSIRKSYQALRLLCSTFPDQNWMSSLEATRWLQHLGAILYSTQVVVSAVEDGRPVLIHCSDGWDRTAQISSLAQLLLDPFYRTIQGFQWLVEREWLQFGHKFADRCGHAVGSGDINEQSPVFVQWLDCVYQITRQFPCHFQFNEAFLFAGVEQQTSPAIHRTVQQQKTEVPGHKAGVRQNGATAMSNRFQFKGNQHGLPLGLCSIKLVQHTYSCLFGTFLFNTCREREKEELTNPTSSVWTLLHPDNTKFHNPLYNESAKEVLVPDWSLHRLTLWSSVYLSNNSLKTSSADEFAASVEQADQVLTPDEEPGGLTKTRSCDNLTTVTNTPQDGASNPTRRSSDPNIGCGGDTMALLSKEVDSSHARNSDDPSSGNASDNDTSDISKSEDTMSEDDRQSEQQADIDGEEEEALQHTVCQNGNQIGKIDQVCNDEEGDVKVWNGVGSSVGASEDEQSTATQTELADGLSLPLGEGLGDGESSSPNGVIDTSPTVNGRAVNGKAEERAIMNGHDLAPVLQNTNCVEVDTQTSESSLVNGDHSTMTTAVDSKAFDSSTDTLTGSEEVDQAFLLKSRRRFNSEHAVSQAVIYQNGGGQNGHSDWDEEGSRLLPQRQDLDSASVESLKLLIQKNCSISTSTTDISDSHVSARGNGMAAEVFSRTGGLGLYIRCTNGMCGVGGMGRRTPSSSEASPSVCSLVATPINSQTPPSTCSPTPGSEGKSSESPLVRQLNSVARHLDCDGLTTFVDPAVERVQNLVMDYQRRINDLENRLETTTNHLNSLMPAYHGAGRGVDPSDFMNLQSELSDGGELSSLGTESNPASDVSWEQVDERDSRITLWVPDHVVTHCAACGGNFWIGRRKHHCRNCGKVYCYTCSNFFAPVPTQHLAEPVRLCGGCYSQLHLSGPGAASDDSRITVGGD